MEGAYRERYVNLMVDELSRMMMIMMINMMRKMMIDDDDHDNNYDNDDNNCGVGGGDEGTCARSCDKSKAFPTGHNCTSQL